MDIKKFCTQNMLTTCNPSENRNFKNSIVSKKSAGFWGVIYKLPFLDAHDSPSQLIPRWVGRVIWGKHVGP
jgi:hypothetical protein